MIEVHAPDGVTEILPGCDLAGVLLEALAGSGLAPADGDIAVVTSKVVSKAEDRLRTGDPDASRREETVRVVADRERTQIVRTRHGLTLAAAGIDRSNVPAGSHLLLPTDPDASARALRRELTARTGVRLGVVITDTAGRAWRHGQTDIAIGAAGLRVLDDHAGRVDGHGNPLAVTAPAVADEVAGAAELAQHKLGGRPFALVRGRADLVTDEDGPGAAALIRPEGEDLFGLGAREAVLSALAGDPTGFGAEATPTELRTAVARVLPDLVLHPQGAAFEVGSASGADDGTRMRLRLLALACGWTCMERSETLRLEPGSAGAPVS